MKKVVKKVAVVTKRRTTMMALKKKNDATVDKTDSMIDPAAAVDPLKNPIFNMVQKDVHMMSDILNEVKTFINYCLRHKNRWLITRWTNGQEPPTLLPL